MQAGYNVFDTKKPAGSRIRSEAGRLIIPYLVQHRPDNLTQAPI